MIRSDISNIPTKHCALQTRQQAVIQKNNNNNLKRFVLLTTYYYADQTRHTRGTSHMTEKSTQGFGLKPFRKKTAWKI